MKKIGIKLRTTNYKASIFIVGLMLFVSYTNGATIASTATGGNWNSTSTWSPAQIPGAGDNVTIVAGSTVTITANASCTSITFTGTGSTLSVSAGITLNVSGALTLNSSPNTSWVTNIRGAGTLTCNSVVLGTSVNSTASTTNTLTSSVTAFNVFTTLNITSSKKANKTSNTIFSQTSGTVTINGSLVNNSVLGSTSTYTLGSISTLNFAGVSPYTSGAGTNITSFTSVGATVIYSNRGIQTVIPTTYANLTLSGSGSKTTTGVIVNGILSMEGTATASVAPTYGSAATLQYMGSTAQTTGMEFPATWSGTGGVKIENANGVTLNGAKNIGTTPFTIGSIIPNSIFNDGGYQLTASGTLNLTSGIFKLGGTATSFPAFGTNNIAPGTTVEYAATTTQTVKGITYSNLTISGAGTNTKTADANITVNGILNLFSANASTLKGCLDMGTFALTMGANAITAGTGDVTGIVTRNSFVTNTPYTFGNQFTTLNISAGTLPSAVSVKIVLTPTHTWKSNAINRYYDIIQTGSDNSTIVTLNLHYLTGELNGATESNFDLFDNIVTGNLVEDHGRSGLNIAADWVSLSNLLMTHVAPGSSFDTKYWTLGTSGGSNFTWIGTSTDWNSTYNWVGAKVPALTNPVTIPDGATTAFDPVLPANTTIKSMLIQPGGILDGGSGTTLTLTGGPSTWDNLGTFNVGTSTIVFTNAAATMADQTNFYNITVADGATLTLGTNILLQIAGTLSLSTSGVLNAASNINTVEYNGAADQIVINPNGTTPGYYHLLLSGSGVKTFPATPMSIVGNLSLQGSVTTIEAGTVSVGANLTIAGGTSLSVSPAKNLTVSGLLSNNAGTSGLVLHSDATGTASLIHNTTDVPATVERYISGDAEAWHFLSSPVSAQSISGAWLPSGTYTNGTGYDLYVWNEPTNCWIYKSNITSAVNWNTLQPVNNFIIGRGYLYSLQASSATNSFVGNLNNGSYDYGLTSNSLDASLKGFNFVGNPYPSPVDWSAATGWNRTNLVNSGGGYDMWIWNPVLKNYGVYNSADPGGVGTNSVTRKIASMQGFFVRTASAGNLSMTNSVRVIDAAGNVFKSQAQQDVDKISLNVKSEDGYGSDEIQFSFGYSKNENGAMKLFSQSKSAPSLYMTNADNKLSVSYFTTAKENKEIPINFVPGNNGTYTFNCNFDLLRHDTVLLEDRLTHKIQNLKADNRYRFNASITDNVNRFVLHFGSVKDQLTNNFKGNVYTDGIHLIVDLTSVSNETNIFVYNMSGQLLLQRKQQGRTLQTFNLVVETQPLVVNLITQNSSYSKKIIWINK